MKLWNLVIGITRVKQFKPEEYLIFEGLSGSHLYGTNDENSDVDTP